MRVVQDMKNNFKMDRASLLGPLTSVIQRIDFNNQFGNIDYYSGSAVMLNWTMEIYIALFNRVFDRNPFKDISYISPYVLETQREIKAKSFEEELEAEEKQKEDRKIHQENRKKRAKDKKLRINSATKIKRWWVHTINRSRARAESKRCFRAALAIQRWVRQRHQRKTRLNSAVTVIQHWWGRCKRRQHERTIHINAINIQQFVRKSMRRRKHINAMKIQGWFRKLLVRQIGMVTEQYEDYTMDWIRGSVEGIVFNDYNIFMGADHYGVIPFQVIASHPMFMSMLYTGQYTVVDLMHLLLEASKTSEFLDTTPYGVRIKTQYIPIRQMY